jgi:hypothetical protein
MFSGLRVLRRPKVISLYRRMEEFYHLNWLDTLNFCEFRLVGFKEKGDQNDRYT